ncbi:hypothetical protein QJS10_CPA01g01100 [Acorus calamus]|uniref:PB1 domain-containing protein n=1 Tax=Acorus calamus TaxID=4465 RepID=A0AAV9FMS1_ACOCL|nr:hypothetical protein QJS10_CPA01g01100 [Acorus calamus]
MSNHHPSDADSTASSLRSTWNDDSSPRVRLMCSFGGRILPRPHDNQLRYVGGETRIVAVNRSTSFASLVSKLSKLCGHTCEDLSVKYQLPSEDLDSLISVTSDEDVDNMMEEFDRLKSPRLRLFLFPPQSGSGSEFDSKRDQWFLDALNGSGSTTPGRLERVRSEASSILSEVPDYLFGLDNNNPDESSKHNKKDEVPSTKPPEDEVLVHPTPPVQAVWQYPMPVYYVPGQVPVPMQFPPPHQTPMGGYRHLFSNAAAATAISEGGYYGGMVPAYGTAGVPVGAEMQVTGPTGSDGKKSM